MDKFCLQILQSLLLIHLMKLVPSIWPNKQKMTLSSWVVCETDPKIQLNDFQAEVIPNVIKTRLYHTNPLMSVGVVWNKANLCWASQPLNRSDTLITITVSNEHDISDDQSNMRFGDRPWDWRIKLYNFEIVPVFIMNIIIGQFGQRRFSAEVVF